MFERILEVLGRHVGSFHREEGGAVLMLALAGALIIFMTGLVMYDAGESARQKVEVQTGSDTAALSHAVVKARSMNMIAYANTAKRIMYGYNVIYVAAYLGLVAAVATYYAISASEYAGVSSCKICFIICVPEPICIASQVAAGTLALVKAIKGTIQLVMETIEASMNNAPTLMGLGVGGDQWRSVKEMNALDFYQEYSLKVAPWWGWGEAVTRGIRNKANLVGTWPPPPGDGTRLRGIYQSLVGWLAMFGVNLSDPTTQRVDTLPIEREPGLPIAAGLAGHMNMCFQTLTAPDFWLYQFWYQHHRASKGYWKDDTGSRRGPRRPFGLIWGNGRHPSPKSLVTGFELASLPMGCLLAATVFGPPGIPYEISLDRSQVLPGSEAEEDWVFATSNYAFGYKPGGGRFDDEGKRKKYSFMKQDYGLTGGFAREWFYQNEGYWSVSRAEIVYAVDMKGGDEGPGGSVDSGPFSSWGNRLQGLTHAPDMWAPRYTARLRPVNLSGERIEDMQSMVLEVVPYMALAIPISVLYGDGKQSAIGGASFSGLAGSVRSFALDVAFFWRAGRGFDKDRMSAGAMPK